MSLGFVQTILDPIHGPIAITKEERTTIDHALVQRLRHVKQLGFLNYIFPSASHTRFEHSIGAMHLAGKLFKSLVNNQIEVLKNPKGFEALQRTQPLINHIEKKDHYEALHQRVRLAALIHDVGHGPFSHVSERLLQKMSPESFSRTEPTLPEWLMPALGKKTEPVRHEVFGYVVACQMFKDLGTDEALFRDALAILNPSLSPAPGSPLTLGLQSLLHELIAGEADCDRMDYLLRDSHFTGVKYGVFDLNRILESLLFTQTTEEGPPQTTFKEDGALAFEYYLFCRNHMHQQIYRHKTNLAFNAMLETLLEEVREPAPMSLASFSRFHDATFPEWLKQHLPKQSQAHELHRDLFGEDGTPKRNPWKLLYSTQERKTFLRAKKHLKQPPTTKDELNVLFHERSERPTRKDELPVNLLSTNAFGDLYEIQSSTQRSGLYQVYLSPRATEAQRKSLVAHLKTLLP